MFPTCAPHCLTRTRTGRSPLPPRKTLPENPFRNLSLPGAESSPSHTKPIQRIPPDLADGVVITVGARSTVDCGCLQRRAGTSN